MVMKRTGIGARIAKGNPSISIFCIRRSKASSDTATTSDAIRSASRTPAVGIERAAEPAWPAESQQDPKRGDADRFEAGRSTSRARETD